MSSELYEIWESYAKTIVENKLTDWKRHPSVTYMLEHNPQFAAEASINYLRNYLSDEDIQRLASTNDRYGNADIKNILGINSSTSSIRYIHQAYDACKHFVDKKLNDVTIIEIGGGYGGLALTVSQMAKILNIRVKKYVIYDLPNIHLLQKYYLTLNSPDMMIEYHDASLFCSDLDKNDTNVLISCYALSEIHPSFMKSYLNNLVPIIKGAFLIWNTSIRDGLPESRDERPEIPDTGSGNRIIRF